MSKVVKETTGWTRSDLTFKMSILASIKFSLYNRSLFFCVVEICFFYIIETTKGLNITLDNLADES